jgi:thiol-disulfide isomerase/thioredoxin
VLHIFWRRLVLVLLLGCTCGVSAAADPAPEFSAERFRTMMNLPADAKLEYQAKDGAALSFEEFRKQVAKGESFEIIKNTTTGVTTLRFGSTAQKLAEKIAAKMPRIDFTDLAGRRVRSADLARKPTLFSFFFESCVPCIKEVPILNAFARKHAEFNYLAITFDSKADAQKFVQQHRLEWPVVAEAMGFIEAAGVKGFPTYLLAAADGRVLGHGSGMDSRAMTDTAFGLQQFEKWVDGVRQGTGGAAGWTPLLDKGLSQFDVYLSYRGDQIMSVLQGKAPANLKPVGLNKPGQNVFTVIEQDGKPVLRISGEYYGCAATKQEFSNYHFRAQVKWGGKKWEPRLTELKDSGILYHSRGNFGVDYWKSWALSQEFQVIEHGLGEYWTIASAAMDIRANPKAPGAEAPKWNAQAPWMVFAAPNNHALAGSDEDKPGEWNSVELVCMQDDCVHIVNGKVVMALANARYKDGARFIPMTGGKLQIQSESAEVFYKDLEIRPIPGMPAAYAQYFK